MTGPDREFALVTPWGVLETDRIGYTITDETQEYYDGPTKFVTPAGGSLVRVTFSVGSDADFEILEQFTGKWRVDSDSMLKADFSVDTSDWTLMIRNDVKGLDLKKKTHRSAAILMGAAMERFFHFKPHTLQMQGIDAQGSIVQVTLLGYSSQHDFSE